MHTKINLIKQWVKGFLGWCDNEHLHSGIKFVTLAQRHAGKDVAILINRTNVYQKAKLAHPERWSGKTRNWDYINEVNLNPKKNKSDIKENKVA
ncbi:MAG: hypothetical protein WBM99_16675 [Psychromonas sp.]